MVGAVLGAGASLLGGLLGSNAAAKGAKAGKKAAKKQLALGKAYTSKVAPAAVESRRAQDEALAAQKAAANAASAKQDRLYAQGLARDQALIQQGQGQAQAAYQPYMDLGTESLAARQGLYGGPGSDAFIDRFHDSPAYRLNYQSMVDEGAKALERSGAARGGLNTGAILGGLATNAGDVSNRLLNQQVGYMDTGINTGLNAAGRLVDAQGRLINTGVLASEFATTGGANAAKYLSDALRADQGAYANNVGTIEQNQLNNYGTGYGLQGQAYANKAAAIAGGATGQAQAWNQAIQNGISAVNNAGPWGSMGGGGGGTTGGGSMYSSAPYTQPNRLMTASGFSNPYTAPGSGYSF